MKDKIKNYLLKFTVIIKHLEKELKNRFNLEDIPYNEVGRKISHEGTFVFLEYTILYKFHGAGCLFKIKGLELDYNIAPLSDNNIKISPWKFLNFMKSCSNIEDDINSLDQRAIFEFLIEFEKAGILSKVPESRGTFEICEVWLEEKLATSDSIQAILKSLIADVR